MHYHKFIASLFCRVGLHRWSARVRYRLLSLRRAIQIDVCRACPARRVRQLPAGGA